MAELGMVRIGSVEVEGRVLGLEQRQEAASHEELAIDGGTEMMRRVPAGWDIRDVDDLSKGILDE